MLKIELGIKKTIFSAKWKIKVVNGFQKSAKFHGIPRCREISTVVVFIEPRRREHLCLWIHTSE